jgi:hypothetical protein
MPQFTGAITINDGATTPVAVSYSPEQLSSSNTVLVDRRETTRDMQPSVTVVFERPTPTRKTFKVKRAYAMPIKQTINGVDVITDIARANVEYVIPQSATQTVRKNLRALVANAEDIAILKAGVEDLDPLY